MITNTTAKSTYIVASGVTEYAIGFTYKTNPDGSPQIKVYKNKQSGAPLIYGVDYTISENGLNIVVDTAVEPGDRLDIIRNIPLVQISDYVIGRIDPEQIEGDFDLAVMRDQQIAADIDFAIEIPEDHEERIQVLESDVDTIESKIPNQATAENQLADKNFVNSSIATSTATFRGTYNSLAELEAVTADDNDYGFVVSTDQAGNTVYSRYKYANDSWIFEYNLNNSSFTSDQWTAINSGATPEIINSIAYLPAAIAHMVIEVQTPTAGNNYTWYRKSADGWVEQGGVISGNGSSTVFNLKVNLPVSMADTNYTLTVGNAGSGAYSSNTGTATTNTAAMLSASTNRKTETSFYIDVVGNLTIDSWEVKGMMAASEMPSYNSGGSAGVGGPGPEDE